MATIIIIDTTTGAPNGPGKEVKGATMFIPTAYAPQELGTANPFSHVSKLRFRGKKNDPEFTQLVEGKTSLNERFLSDCKAHTISSESC